jgi:hypothetical protein
MELFDNCIVISQSRKAQLSDFFMKSDRRDEYELRYIEDMSYSIRLVHEGYKIQPGYEAYGDDFNNPGRQMDLRKVSTLVIKLNKSFEGKTIKVELYCDYGSFDALDEIFHRMHRVEDGKRLSTYANAGFLVDVHRDHLTILDHARGLLRGTSRVYYKNITEVVGAEECYIITDDGQKIGDDTGYKDQLPIPRNVLLGRLPEKKTGNRREQKVRSLANAPLPLFTFASKPNWLGRNRLLKIYVDQLFVTPQSGFGEVICIPVSQIRGARIEVNQANPTAKNSTLILDLTSGTSRHFSLPHAACLAAREAISQAQLYNA